MKPTLPSLLAIMSLTIMGCDDQTPDEENPDASEKPLLEQAVEAMGGAGSLNDLKRFRIESAGTRRIDYEGMEPSEVHDTSTYTRTYVHDLSTDSLRVDTVRTSVFEAFQFFPPESYSVVLNGDVGGLTAQAGFFPPGAMPSQHVGALRQQQRLFNPHILLRFALANPAAVSDGGEEDYDGLSHRILAIMDQDVEVRLFVNPESGLISKLETMENSPLFRDVPVEVRYEGWKQHGVFSFPTTVELYAVEGLVHEETRSSVDIEPADVAAGAFDLPPEAGTPEVDADEFAFGRQSHLVVEAFFQILFGYEQGGAVEVSELTPGVMLLSAGHNSLAALVDERLVVIEAPISPAHGTHIVETLASEFPGVPISHVVQSHHHQDHSAGVRSLAAVGAKLVVGPGVKSFYEDVLAASSTLRPDALSRVDVETEVEEVAQGATSEIAGPTVTVTAYHMSANTHSADLLLTLVDTGAARVIYVADLYNAGVGFSPVLGGPESFFAAMRDLEIIDQDCVSELPLTIIPSHGLAQSLEDSITELDGLEVDIGCP